MTSDGLQFISLFDIATYSQQLPQIDNSEEDNGK